MKSDLAVRRMSIFVATLMIATFCFFSFEAFHLSTHYSVKDFYPTSHPILNDEMKTAQVFELSDSPVFYVALTLNPDQAGHWLVPERISELEAVTQKLNSSPGVKKATSVANLDMALELGKNFEIGPLLKSLPPEKWVSFATSRSLLNSQLISSDLRSVLVFVEPMDNSSILRNRLASELPDLSKGDHWSVKISGVPAVQASLANRLNKEAAQFLALSLILFCVMFLFFYRNLDPLLFAAAGLVLTNVTSMGWLTLFHVPFTILLTTLPVMVSISFVSITIHTLHLWSDRMKTPGPDRGELARFRAAAAVLWELSLPNLLGSLTTSIGFITLATANIPAVRTYAIVVALVVLWTWLVSQVLLIGFLYRLSPVPRRWNHARAWWMLELNRWTPSIITIAAGVGVLFAASATKMNFSSRLYDDLPDSEQVSVSTAMLDEYFGGTVPMDISLQTPDRIGWKNPVRLHKLRAALTRIRKIPGVGSALSVTDFMGKNIPQTVQGAAEIYFLFGMDPEDPLRQYLSGDFREVRIAMRLKDVPSEEVTDIRDQARAILHSNDPQIEIRETGIAVNNHILNQEFAKRIVFGFWQSLLLIGVFLVFVFRSVRWALVACVPNLIPPAVLIGTLAFFQTPVTPGIALIFSIALGLAFNNTVYLLTRLKRVQEKMKMATLPLRRALLEEGNPCFSESFVMFAGFMIFLTSGFKLNQTFGAYMVLAICAGALADLIVLPAILRRFSSFLWER